MSKENCFTGMEGTELQGVVLKSEKRP